MRQKGYQDTCVEVIARYEGHIAQYFGDGLLVYFGYPQADGDDAPRAVWAGLGMVEAIGQLNTQPGWGRGVQLAVRLAIHTGMVVVGDVGLIFSVILLTRLWPIRLLLEGQ